MVLYIRPNGEGHNIISFSEFKAVVETFHDPISERFAQSLDEWATIKAGHGFQAPEVHQTKPLHPRHKGVK